MSSSSLTSQYEYNPLAAPESFRIVEVLPGRIEDAIRCVLHPVEWTDKPQYEAVSYAWGDPKARTRIICGKGDVLDGAGLDITKNLHSALLHFRYEDRSRFLWADALCINQRDIPERGLQVKQMKRIYESSQRVLVWLGPDSESPLPPQASLAIDTVRRITQYLIARLDVSLDELKRQDNMYPDLLFPNRSRVPLPDACDVFVTPDMWRALLWFYSHAYFTRVWVIQEVNAHRERLVHCGRSAIEWSQVELVAGYIVLETAFSKSRGFSKAHCWWVSTVATELRHARNWLHMLYLASNFSASDPRDVVYGLRGMMRLEREDAAAMLNPDYGKTTLQVYRDSVEAALLDYGGSTNVLVYSSGRADEEPPSWVPRWDRAMLFRNPFRFGKPVPWRPAGDRKAVWSIDRDGFVLTVAGLVVDSVELVAPYRETLFGNVMMASEEGRGALRSAWERILATVAQARPSSVVAPLDEEILTTVATSFSFGLDDKCSPAEPSLLMRNFVAYLEQLLDGETFGRFVAPAVWQSAAEGGGSAAAFGKPVWDFEYPQSSVFVTRERRLIGCSVDLAEPGDVLFIPLGCSYPLILRPNGDPGGDRFRISGYCFVHGIMYGEIGNFPEMQLKII